MKPSEQLRAARALIEDPARWTQRAYARNHAGDVVSSKSSSAVCWCALGAVFRTGGIGWLARIDRLTQQANGTSIKEVNDYQGHAAVLDLYDRAIAAAEAEEAK